MTKALITGITGQDSSYLAELLLDKGIKVYGLQRRTSSISTVRIEHILNEIENLYGDLADTNSIVRILMKVKPDMIFNIGSMSHVRISFDIPEYTAQVTGLAPLRILEALRSLDMKEVRMYQASSSEMFGSSPPPQNEDTPMLPQSPYGCSKLFAYNMMRVYRTGYGMFACNGILFNHSGERRGINFVEQKICHGAAKIKLGVSESIRLGNIEAKRDWGHAKDYCVLGETKVLIQNPDRSYHKIGQKQIKDLGVGDWVLSYNESNGNKEFDKIINIMKRKVNDIVKVTFSNGNYLDITDNHPIGVIKQGKLEWVEVGNLHIGDKVIQKLSCGLTQRLWNINNNKLLMDDKRKQRIGNFRRGKTYNEMYGERAEEILAKRSKSMHERYVSDPKNKEKRCQIRGGKNNGNYKYGKTLIRNNCEICGKILGKNSGYYDAHFCRSCVSRITSKRLWQDDEYRNKVVHNTMMANNISPNKAETKLMNILNEVCPNEFKYTGNGEVVIHGFNPDFTNINGKKKLIELFGDYWHKGENPNRKKTIYKQYGFDCLVIWEHELKDENIVRNKLETFLFNPSIEVVTVLNIEKKNMSVDVYNIETEKNNNYFAYGILVHNCKAIIKIIEHNKPDDFVIATGEQHTVREFAERVFKKLDLNFYDYVVFDEQYLRPNEVPSLLGDSTKARTVLGWKPEINFDQLIDLMVNKAMEEEEFKLYQENKKNGVK
jgi:GDP-mannose 4,6-dehydratase